MKLITLLFLMPLLAFSNQFSHYSKGDRINPEALKSGMSIKTITKFIDAKKSTKLIDGRSLHRLKSTAIDIGNISVKDAFVISENGIITSLSLLLNKHEGSKFLSKNIEKFGMPVGEIIDVYEWRIDDVLLEIHQTEAEYIATYTPVRA